MFNLFPFFKKTTPMEVESNSVITINEDIVWKEDISMSCLSDAYDYFRPYVKGELIPDGKTIFSDEAVQSGLITGQFIHDRGCVGLDSYYRA